MYTLKTHKKLAVISALVEGASIRSIERMTEVHRDTIMRLLVSVGDNCAGLLDRTIGSVCARLVQVDEIWTFCYAKTLRCGCRCADSRA